MRRQFRDTVTELAAADERVVLVFGDISVFLFEAFDKRFGTDTSAPTFRHSRRPLRGRDRIRHRAEVAGTLWSTNDRCGTGHTATPATRRRAPTLVPWSRRPTSAPKKPAAVTP